MGNWKKETNSSWECMQPTSHKSGQSKHTIQIKNPLSPTSQMNTNDTGRSFLKKRQNISHHREEKMTMPSISNQMPRYPSMQNLSPQSPRSQIHAWMDRGAACKRIYWTIQIPIRHQYLLHQKEKWVLPPSTRLQTSQLLDYPRPISTPRYQTHHKGTSGTYPIHQVQHQIGV